MLRVTGNLSSIVKEYSSRLMEHSAVNQNCISLVSFEMGNEDSLI